ncbi:MAG: hypothetical protein IIX48_04540 [Lachnospiraceae bacterium]|nr:hypothetical protein [Lachnospiraceae bacterium]
MNRKRFPLILMLVAGVVTSIVLYIKNYTLIKFLWILVASLIVFYIIGRLFVNVIERFDQENVEADEQTDSEDEDGAVIEKEAGP